MAPDDASLLSRVMRSSSSAAEAVSGDLRESSSELVERRRRVAALSLGGSAALGAVALYQFGLVRHLPDPPLRLFASERVDAAGEAYALLSTPDSALGMASYAATAILAGMGGEDRARTQPLVPLLLGAKVAIDAVTAVWLTAEQIVKHRRLCFYCLVAAATSVAALPQVVPETRLAWRELRRR